MAIPKYQGIFTIGNDPRELASKNGQGLNFRLVASDNHKNEQTGKWETSRELWLDTTTWRDNIVAKQWAKGDKVYANGVLSQHVYEKDGQKRYTIRYTVLDMWKIEKNQPSSNNEFGGRAAGDPWGSDVQSDFGSFDQTPF